ncbi:MAG TPA: hypothetical protein VIY47_00170 [Ignavibacteriaceae bacterium]
MSVSPYFSFIASGKDGYARAGIHVSTLSSGSWGLVINTVAFKNLNAQITTPLICKLQTNFCRRLHCNMELETVIGEAPLLMMEVIPSAQKSCFIKNGNPISHYITNQDALLSFTITSAVPGETISWGGAEIFVHGHLQRF